jgi:mRNA interferase RelE/StbE
VAAYTVDARPRVRKALRQFDPTVRKNVLAKMRALATDPRPPGTEPLRGYSPWLRVRVGDYRIIYAVADDTRVVTVGTVGHRREVYRHLDL